MQGLKAVSTILTLAPANTKLQRRSVPLSSKNVWRLLVTTRTKLNPLRTQASFLLEALVEMC